MRLHRLESRDGLAIQGVIHACLLVATFVLLGAPAAHAYPQWQFSSGASRCNQCHFNPAGGGLVTGFGRDAMGEELSTWAGDGAFLHGAVDLPARLALGADVRLAAIDHDVGNSDGPTRALFPMQADVAGRLGLLDSFSVLATMGVRGQVRRDSGPVASDNFTPAGGSRVISREHYLMWRPSSLGPYVRAGRFFAPFGLRLAEHGSYVRRDVGFNLLEETYGVSGGAVAARWEVHATAFAPDFFRGLGGRERGFAFLFEGRPGECSAVGLSGRAGFADGARRLWSGIFGKTYIEPLRTLLMVETNLGDLRGASGSASSSLASFGGATVFAARGLWLGLHAERAQTDLRVRDSATNAVNGQINWFPYPHFELVLLGRLQAADGQGAARTLLLQVHYFL